MRKLVAMAALALALNGSTRADAQTYPVRPITIVEPYPAGGPTDVLVRVLSERMRASLGQPLIADYVSGAAGTLALARVARAAPDGYTIQVGHLGSNVVVPALYPLSFDVLKDLAPVAQLPNNPFLLVGRPSIPAKDLRELIAWIKANEGKVSVGTPGVNSLPHVAGIYFQNLTGTQFPLVPYRGAGPMMLDLIAGQIDLAFDQVQSSLPQIREGRIKPFAVTAPERLAVLPDVPTVNEAGLPSLDILLWYGLWVPAGTPPEVIGKLNAAARDAMGDPATRQRLAEMDMQVPPADQQTPQALGALQQAEIKKWWPVMKAAGLKPE
ncbi:MAG TPA: tripartite tricarboxylate transporter substrate-binding protein [Xanthobacteraceae bacterium]|jgi:tripartite-type tricarboxylate transporter receptor subunit TctC|nr:tripartite tricarboxylate transporter substrate-binding protein [Xanthobacteraceae bacterium]